MQTTSNDFDKRVPVTVVTGFLGAGKTTLINSVLADASGRRLAIIVNEFGDIGIDGELIESGEEELIELNSGCICCVVRGDLIRTLRQLLVDKPNLDGIIIETTGLANPSPVIQTTIVDQFIGAKCRLDSVVCLVDAAHITKQLDRWPDASDQIVFSDHLILNKADEVSDQLDEIKRQLRALNQFAKIVTTNYSYIPSKDVLDQNSYSLDRIADKMTDALDIPHVHNHHIDKSGISSVSLTSSAPVDAEKFEQWIQELLSQYGSDILRTKGILSVAGENRKLVIQAVNMMLEGEFRNSWNEEQRISRIVFIGRKLSREFLQSSFENCLVTECV